MGLRPGDVVYRTARSYMPEAFGKYIVIADLGSEQAKVKLLTIQNVETGEQEIKSENVLTLCEIWDSPLYNLMKEEDEV